MNLVILDRDDFLDEQRCILSDHRAEHIRKILRCRTGETIEVGLINGPAGIAVIERVDANEILLRCTLDRKLPPPYPEIDLILALPRPQTLKKVLITAAGMGVRRIHLIRANRVEKSYFHSPLLKRENYNRFLIEGLSQGKLTRLTKIDIYDKFRPFFEDALPVLEDEDNGASLRLLPDPECDCRLSDVYKEQVGRVLLAIGPEGGWVPFEMELMKKADFKAFKLGGWILKVETALAAAVGQIELRKNSI